MSSDDAPAEDSDPNPLEQAVEGAMDTFVYAPIGLLFDGPALFPKLVEKGRNQVQVARMMGQMAVQMGQGEATKRVGKAHEQVRDSLVAMGIVPTPRPEPAPERPSEPASTTPASKAASTRAKAAKKQAKKAAAKAPKTPSAANLGIPDYDSLSASQVVSRLRGLSPAELDAVRAYESGTRARKTILNRVTQLKKA